MHRATPSSSSASSSSSSAHRARKRHLTRDQLLKSLQLLGQVSAPLPAELPPSPPASREPSPALGLKRRHDADPGPSSSKRPRTSSVSSSSRPPLPSRPVPISAASTSRHEPAEDGEVREDPTPAPTTFTPIPLPASFPVRRPRRGTTTPVAAWGQVYEKCFANARKFKYSAYARVAAAHPPTSKDYKALRVPPPPGSGYAQHALLMARLELMDSLLHFIYGLWCVEHSARTCWRGSWRTVDDALSQTEAKWQAESNDEREKAFVGLIQMIHAFIHGRKLTYKMRALDGDLIEIGERYKVEWRAAIGKAAAARAAAQAAEPSPRMLPSPAASSTSSSNSTPLGGHGNAAAANGAQSTTSVTPIGEPPIPEEFRAGVKWKSIMDHKGQTAGLRAAAERIGKAQMTLNLPVMFKHFPRTFARMINTTLSPQDELEPDFQDDECELYWPGQVLGEGLGWVCLMGMSMVKEFGRDYGYEGLSGVVQRTSGDPDLGYIEPRLVIEKTRHSEPHPR